MIKWLIIILILLCSAGCKSPLKEIDFSITGLEMEFYEPEESEKKEGFQSSGNWKFWNKEDKKKPDLMNRDGTIGPK
ncbi:MAG TPA: hypothetical protein EYG21_03725 [Nitrospinaceae bacterium]|jgi:hypothetical protein|nr:hypothetical protein [Nitrospinaceae bacterium]